MTILRLCNILITISILLFHSSSFAQYMNNVTTTTTPTAPPTTNVNSDEEINLRVEDKLGSHLILTGAIIKVSTRQGVVYLSGTVETQSQKDAAISTARSVAGVIDVNADNLQIKYPTP